MAASNYVPGVCNINTKEIAARRNTGHAGLVVSVIVLLLFIFTGVHYAFGLLLAGPVWLMATGYIQAKEKFCVGHGAAGTQFADDSMKSYVEVTNQAARRKDRARARAINTQALAIGVAGGILSTLVLVLL